MGDDYRESPPEEDPPEWDPWEDPDWRWVPRWRGTVTVELPEEDQQ